MNRVHDGVRALDVEPLDGWVLHGGRGLETRLAR
jgi:hypothetical protein